LIPLILFAASPGTITGVITSTDGGGLVHDVTMRFMDLLVLAMGVQFAPSGYQPFSIQI